MYEFHAIRIWVHGSLSVNVPSNGTRGVSSPFTTPGGTFLSIVAQSFHLLSVCCIRHADGKLSFGVCVCVCVCVSLCRSSFQWRCSGLCGKFAFVRRLS